MPSVGRQGKTRERSGDASRHGHCVPRLMTSLFRRVLPLAVVTATVLSAGWGARATLRGKPWYRTLRKSRLTPPDAAFGPVWTLIYALESVSAVRVGRAAPSPERSRALALWAV